MWLFSFSAHEHFHFSAFYPLFSEINLRNEKTPPCKFQSAFYPGFLHQLPSTPRFLSEKLKFLESVWETESGGPSPCFGKIVLYTSGWCWLQESRLHLFSPISCTVLIKCNSQGNRVFEEGTESSAKIYGCHLRTTNQLQSMSGRFYYCAIGSNLCLLHAK